MTFQSHFHWGLSVNTIFSEKALNFTPPCPSLIYTLCDGGIWGISQYRSVGLGGVVLWPVENTSQVSRCGEVPEEHMGCGDGMSIQFQSWVEGLWSLRGTRQGVREAESQGGHLSRSPRGLLVATHG